MHITNRDCNSFGNWELDGVESRQSPQLVLTFVERLTRYAVAIKVPSKHANDIKLGIDTVHESVSAIRQIYNV